MHVADAKVSKPDGYPANSSGEEESIAIGKKKKKEKLFYKSK